ncbi:protein RD3-like [Anarrhichthys ocellatus]|uniref:protein RD3-like n=1 Tax=Anarrhichthys ocellatus TaxID=433405 RepID=UPI0012EE0838|nr:protein RD3-like [Anarrhichthys ocellatus]XP_031702883.1 protein RD3-like [Anarrhichthys ocellatus]
MTAMPLFSWMKWSHETKVQAREEAAPPKTSVVVPSRMLIRELLWHVEERERLVRELDREHRLAHGALGLHWFQKYPRLRTLIPTSELHQLEFLCAQIPPVHAATVLSRFREVLATNNIRPWELASVFKQVLRDFLSQKEHEEENFSVQAAELRPTDAWTSCYIMKQGFVTPTVPNCRDHPREEIPTISGYVDRAMRHSGLFAGSNRDWDLPDYYPVPLRPSGTYSTTL